MSHARFNKTTLATAELAAQNALPKVYELQREDDDLPLRFAAFGCQGSGKSSQQHVADLLKDLMTKPEQERPEFVLLLGDNVYDFGAASADDSALYETFHGYYNNPEINLPFFVILGNHDENLHSHNRFVAEKGIKRGLHEVAHSYLPDQKYLSVDSKKILYANDILKLAQMPAWNMPSRYYALDGGNTVIFCVDSNSYARDYLNYIKKDDTQALWLAKEYNLAKEQGKRVILAQHHALYTPGQRAYKGDSKHYLEPDQIAFFNELYGIDLTHKPYNTLLAHILNEQGLHFDCVLAAHDHSIYYYNDSNTATSNPLCQLTLGGGGGGLQERKEFSKQAQMGCYLKVHGLGVVTCPEDREQSMLFDIFTTKGLELNFTSSSTKTLQVVSKWMDNTDRDKTIKFIWVVKQALEKYFAFLGEQQHHHHGKFFLKNASHGTFGANRAHKVWAIISNKQIDSYLKLVKDVYDVIYPPNPTNTSHHSLKNMLNQIILTEYHNVLADSGKIDITLSDILEDAETSRSEATRRASSPT